MTEDTALYRNLGARKDAARIFGIKVKRTVIVERSVRSCGLNPMYKIYFNIRAETIQFTLFIKNL